MNDNNIARRNGLRFAFDRKRDLCLGVFVVKKMISPSPDGIAVYLSPEGRGIFVI
jgi:hypothetical protein